MAAPAKKSLVLGTSPYEHYGSIVPFDRLFDKWQDVQKDGFDGVDAVVLWGGRDIHPSFYKQKASFSNHAPVLPSERDVFEWKTMLYCKAKGIPLIGICRGAQFICAAAGGTLVQHMTGHNYDHDIDTIKGKKVKSTSVHHQMMNPWNVQHTLIAWAEPHRCERYEGQDGMDIPEMHKHPEPEIVYFPTVKGLAIQGHPEYGHASKEFVDLCLDLVTEYLLAPF